MAVYNKGTHLSFSDRQIIEKGIINDSTKSAIAAILGKDKSTIGKEIKTHLVRKHHCSYPVECALFSKCTYRKNHTCNSSCPKYKAFYCQRRDRSPGACNGCSKSSSCRYDKYYYYAQQAQQEYRDELTGSRIGVNATLNQIRQLGEMIKPELDKGHSIYVIKQNHPEITLSEQTLYNYVENGVFQDAGISISCMELTSQIRRNIPKKKTTAYSPRKDRSYLKGRTKADFEEYMELNPNARVVEMDTVYNRSDGPFIQTFKFLDYDFLFCVFHKDKSARSMLNGILLLEKILGKDIFNREVAVLKTDRGGEFVLAAQAEIREDGTRRTRVFYCDPMCSWQKGSLENVHILLREICPKEIDLFQLNLTSQAKADLITVHINSYPKEKLNGKTSFQLLDFLSHDMAKRFEAYGIAAIDSKDVILKPYLLK